MKKIIFVLIAIVTISLPVTYAFSDESIINEEPQPKLSHRQEVWMYALEWCESRGDTSAINEEDLDGTPSYGAFQFKPSTLDFFAKKYGVATTTIMDYETQKEVLTQMILHRNEIKWKNQFPYCVKKLGLPPAR